jgi:hypothetical protein
MAMKFASANTRLSVFAFSRGEEKKAIKRLGAQAVNSVLRRRSICEPNRDHVGMQWRLPFHRSRTGVPPQKVKCKKFAYATRPGWTVSGLGT